MAEPAEMDSTVVSLKLLFHSLNLLIEPSSSKESLSDDTSKELLDSVLENNLAAFKQLLTTSQELQEELEGYSVLLLQDIRKSFLDASIVPIRQKFTEVCICLLDHIRYNITKATKNKSTALGSTATCEKSSKEAGPSLPPDVISLQQEKIIGAAFQFVVVLGICPYLVPGVGIPVSQRLGPGQILLATIHDYSTELTDLNRIQILIPVIKLFCSMLDIVSLKDIILNNYLSDILAALLQVRYCAKVIIQRNEKVKQDITDVSHGCSNRDNDFELCKGESKQQISPLQQSHAQNKMVVVGEHFQSQIPGSNVTNIFFCNELPEMYLDASGLSWTLESVSSFCNKEIDRAIRSSAVPHVLTELMLLSGGTKSSVGLRPMVPVWFRRTIAGILRDVIMAPPGIQHLITFLIGDHNAPNAHSQDWQKSKAVAQIISRCPLNPSNIRQFYTSVSRQLIELLQMYETKPSSNVIRAVGGVVLELTNQQPDLMQDVCLSHLLSPLMQLSCDTADSVSIKDRQILVSEEILTQCIVCLHKLFVVGQEPQSSLLSKLRGVTRILFSVYVLARNSVSFLRSLTADLIQAYLSSCDAGDAARCLMSFVSACPDDSQECPTIIDSIVLESGPDGGLQAVFIKDKQLDIDSWTQPPEGVVDILSSLSSDSVTSQLFLCLLKKLTNIVSSEFANTEVILPTRALSAIQQTDKLSELKEKISLVCLLASMGEKFGTQVIQSAYHVLIFAKATLERCVKVCQFSLDESTISFEWETVSMAMGLLSAILSGALELSDADKKMLDELLPLLSAISDSDLADATVKEMADDLKVAVATRGLVWAEISKLRSKKVDQDTAELSSSVAVCEVLKAPTKSTHSLQSFIGCFKKAETKKPNHVQQVKPLIQVLSETSITESPVETSVTDEVMDTKVFSRRETDKGASKAARMGKLEEALQDLCDPLLPVRGHGLISLARLVEDRDPEVKEKQDLLLKIFMENLTHADSYIYLAAVNGLAALSDVYPDHIIPCLTTEFRSKCLQGHSSKSAEIVLKVGESVVKATKRLGELAPKYRDYLLPVILCGCCHEDALVRASSLSGLADVCKLLRFSVGPILHELTTCCRDIINSDPDPEPRKAAILTITLLLRGLGKDMLTVLGDVLLDIYRALKHSFTFDNDEKVKFNANVALGELDDIMKEALFTKPELKKTISILGYQ